MEPIKMAFIDTETTGLDYENSAIVQFGGIIEMSPSSREKGTILHEFNINLRPHDGADIQPKALQTNGLTMDQIMEFQSHKEGLKELKDILSQYVSKFDKTDKFFFIGYNASFDFQMTHALFKRCGDVYCGSWFWYPFIDVAVLAGIVLMNERANLPNFKLMTVAKYLGIEINEEEAHDAMYDITITREVYYALVARSIGAQNPTYGSVVNANR